MELPHNYGQTLLLKKSPKGLETDDSLLPRFLFFCLQTFPIQAEGYKRHFSKLVETEIPLPPLDEQERIVAELEGYRKVIEGARQILANYKRAFFFSAFASCSFSEGCLRNRFHDYGYSLVPSKSRIRC